jgi:CO dehydrogenase/CO-methylating acetyl-CoA synthase complex beta subunit
MTSAEIVGKDDLERAERLVQKCIEVRGVKIKITDVPIPVPYGAAFEGEVVRRPDMRMEFGGKETRTFEYLRMLPMDQVTDGDIQMIGPDVDDTPVGGAVSLGIVVEVAGRKMQADFEPVLERQFHYFINGASGIQHTGQRDITWIRISKAAADKGFGVRDLAKIIHAKLHASFGAIVDKVQIKLITDPKLHAEWLAQAREAYTARNSRLANMTDESVDTFYSCILCQSFAPTHVCVISPERLGLCGAYNWLDCRASYEINATGPNQPIVKGKCYDPINGYWKGVNEYAVKASNGAVSRVSLYSIMNDPMTACGCFECSVMYIPEANGVAVISREDPGMTPTGMKFSTLAGICGGGNQNPGMMGIGKYYVLSPKFISADGGFKRVVWMSANLKQAMAEELKAVAEREGDPELINRIADGENVTEMDQLLSWLKEHKHPALDLPPMQTTDFDEGAESEPEVAEAPSAPVANKTNGEEKATRVETIPVEMKIEPAPVPIEEPKAALEAAPVVEVPAMPVGPQTPTSAPGAVAGTADVQAIAELTANIVLGKMQNALVAMLRELGGAVPGGVGTVPSAVPVTEVAQPVTPMNTSLEAEPIAPAATAKAPVQTPVAKTEPVATPVVTETKTPPRHLKTTKHEVLGAPWMSNSAAGVQLHKEKWTGKIVPVTLGATAAEGGTRSRTVIVGGENNLPYLFDEGSMPHAPALGLEILDQKPSDWSPLLMQAWEGVMDDPAIWAKAAEAKGAETILLRLSATKADGSPNTTDNVRATVRKVLKATGLPLIVFGPGQAELDGEFLVAVAEEGKGERLALGLCEQGNYRTIVAAAMANDQLVVTSTAMDVNLAKQLAILVNDMGMPTDRVLMDPTCAGVGYGIEYGYSVMERLRLAALTGDKMVQSPVILAVGYEAWRQKESRVGEGVPKQWGDWMERAINWETLTAAPLIEVGADLLLLRHPESLRRIRALIQELMVGAGQTECVVK